MNLLIQAYFFFLPAGLANMAPVLANKVPLLNRWKTPLDFGKKYKGERIFGPNKTWRGLVSGVIVASLAANIEAHTFYKASPNNILFITLAGALMGFGALAGDAIESHFKRRVGVKAGDSWFPFDQLDYIFGGLIMVSPLILWSNLFVATVIVEYFGLHLITSYLAFKLKLKNKPI